MIVRALGFGMGVARFSQPLRGVGVLSMLDMRIDTLRHIESVCKVPPGIGMLRLLVPSVVVGVYIDLRSVADGV